MAMACTFTRDESIGVGGLPVRVYTYDWVSDVADGDVDDSVQTDLTRISGEILRVVTIPGSPAPTNGYDVVLTDEDGYDVLAGQAANRSSSTVQSVAPGVPLSDGTTTSVGPMPVHSKLTLGVTNAGNSKAGKVKVYVR